MPRPVHDWPALALEYSKYHCHTSEKDLELNWLCATERYKSIATEIKPLVHARGGVSEKSDSVGGFDPPPFFKNGPRGGFKGAFRRTHIICAIFFSAVVFLDSTSRVLSLPQIQRLLILSP